jgi:signal transduction histidine kinase
MNHLATHRVEVVLMNLTLPDYKGLDAIRAIRMTMPACALVALGTAAQDRTDIEAIRAGAHEFLSLSTLSPETLDASITRALARTESPARPLPSSALSSPSSPPARAVHDLNNAVTAINGFADILLTRLPLDDQARPNVEQIRKAGTRASLLIRSLSSESEPTPSVPLLCSDATSQPA